MQWVLERLKGRVGVAVVLLLVVLAAVAIGRAAGGGHDPDPALPALGSGNQTTPAIQATEEDDGVEDGPSAAEPKPSLRPGAAQPVRVARDFLDAWLRSDLPADRWHAGLSPYATPALAAKLDGVDPAGVPAQRVTDEPTVIPRSTDATAVRIPVDSGTVELRLVVTGGRWLVDGVDWSRG